MSELTLDMYRNDSRTLAVIDDTRDTAIVKFYDKDACARACKANLLGRSQDGVFVYRDTIPFKERIFLNGRFREWVEAGMPIRKAVKHE